jgi:hypothetical protein
MMIRESAERGQRVKARMMRISELEFHELVQGSVLPVVVSTTVVVAIQWIRVYGLSVYLLSLEEEGKQPCGQREEASLQAR